MDAGETALARHLRSSFATTALRDVLRLAYDELAPLQLRPSRAKSSAAQHKTPLLELPHLDPERHLICRMRPALRWLQFAPEGAVLRSAIKDAISAARAASEAPPADADAQDGGATDAVPLMCEYPLYLVIKRHAQDIRLDKPLRARTTKQLNDESSYNGTPGENDSEVSQRSRLLSLELIDPVSFGGLCEEVAELAGLMMLRLARTVEAEQGLNTRPGTAASGTSLASSFSYLLPSSRPVSRASTTRPGTSGSLVLDQ